MSWAASITVHVPQLIFPYEPGCRTSATTVQICSGGLPSCNSPVSCSSVSVVSNTEITCTVSSTTNLPSTADLLVTIQGLTSGTTGAFYWGPVLVCPPPPRL